MAKSLLHEMDPQTTKQYADMLHYVMHCDIQPHTKHNELYLSPRWRVRKQYIDYANVTIDHKKAVQHGHRLKMFNILVQCLHPKAQAPVRTLLSCRGTPA